ncbi:MAG: cytochrome c [Paracoccaceae bacterium]|nr:cytochrome c [Paracoccaceae bacterium]MDG1737870.1 cytochrome c [Paracoccaceae bacterium]MDG2259097.1 cytochrome c [Paracoccaceae bacterium]
MKRTLLLAAGFATALTSSAFAQDPFLMPVAARQGIMAILAMNMGTLGGMARGKIDYDAEAAQTAANAIYGVSMVDYASLFPEGSDDFNLDGTRAASAIFDNPAGFSAEWAKVQMAAPTLAAEAANGKDAMVAALGGVGGTCRACHMSFRAPE